MKKFIYLIVFLLLIISCNSAFSACKADTNRAVLIDTSSIDSAEYELIVFDIGYETFLITQPPMEFYSKEYYKNWNTLYVTEWNLRYITQAKTGFYETQIDYDPLIDYGIELEYRLYYYFQFFEQKNNVTLIQRAK